MHLPKHHELREPALRAIADAGHPITGKDLEPLLAKHFVLLDSLRFEMYESGNSNQTIFFNRMMWAISSLYQAKLITKPKRGEYLISDLGKQILATEPNVAAYVKKKLRQIRKERQLEVPDTDADVEADVESETLTPKESLSNSARKLRQAACDEILQTMLEKSPKFFEEIVVKLLQRLGYGGGISGSGYVTQYVNDFGIDGVIKEDILGLGQIHVQAKRYAAANTVGREDIQKFVGALATAKSNKGVLITTSNFTKGAIDYVETLHGSVQLVLINGEELARYMYDTGLGMKVDEVIEIKGLNSDFWDAAD